MKVGKYNLVNADKVERAINGTVLDRGMTKGGVGEGAEPSAILAEYDRIGGLILFENKYKVKTGSFFDFKAKKPIAKPKPKLVFSINGESVEVDADKALPLEIQASEAAGEKKRKRATAKRGGKKEDSGDSEENEEAEEENAEDAELA